MMNAEQRQARWHCGLSATDTPSWGTRPRPGCPAPAQLPAGAPGKAAEDSSSAQACAAHVGDEDSSGTGLDLTWLVQTVWGVNKMMEELYCWASQTSTESFLKKGLFIEWHKQGS